MIYPNLGKPAIGWPTPQPSANNPLAQPNPPGSIGGIYSSLVELVAKLDKLVIVGTQMRDVLRGPSAESPPIPPRPIPEGLISQIAEQIRDADNLISRLTDQSVGMQHIIEG